MINRLLPFIFIVIFQLAKAQNEFVTIWKPSNPSTTITNSVPYESNSNQIWFPARGNNFNVYWEEIGFPTHNGSINNITSSINFLIDFGTPFNPNTSDATYKIWVEKGNGDLKAIKFGESINPNLPVPTFYANGDAKKLIEVSQWGNNTWTTFDYGFTNCTNMDVTATDLPNFSNATNLSFMFYSCNKLLGNPSFGNWDTSNITNMRFLFATGSAFNQPIGNWDVSNVTDMGWMFHYLTTFNQPLNNWNTSKVTKMDHMFHQCASFNQPLSNWDTSSVTDMSTMFTGSTSFNQNLGMWDLSSLNSAQNILANTGLDCENYDRTLYGWRYNPNTPNNINIGLVAPLIYANPLAIDARNYLINNKGWSIVGDTYNGECKSVILANKEVHTISELQIYPNPASQYIFLKSKVKILTAEIIDKSGKLISKETNPKEKIDIKSLSNGNYFLILYLTNEKRTFKFIKN